MINEINSGGDSGPRPVTKRTRIEFAFVGQPEKSVSLKEVDMAVRAACDPTGQGPASRCEWYCRWNPEVGKCFAVGMSYAEILQTHKDMLEQMGPTVALLEIGRMLEWFAANVIVRLVTVELTEEQLADVLADALAAALVDAIQQSDAVRRPRHGQ